jgi:hypothetical protein
MHNSRISRKCVLCVCVLCVCVSVSAGERLRARYLVTLTRFMLT